MGSGLAWSLAEDEELCRLVRAYTDATGRGIARCVGLVNVIVRIVHIFVPAS